MKRTRSALPLPRYVVRKPLKSGWGFFFYVPTWARKAGCPMSNEPLGTDHAAAVERAETVLLPAFDAWRTGGDEVKITTARTGTLDWVFAEYRADRRFTRLAGNTRRHHETSFRLVGHYKLKNGQPFGKQPLSAITGAVVDQLYDKLCTVSETDADGNTIERERRTTINYAMKTCRRAWNVVARRHPGKMPVVNPFAAMGLKSSTRQTPTATYQELQAFRTKAIEMGLPSLATAALIGWEWLQREADIFGTFDVNSLPAKGEAERSPCPAQKDQRGKLDSIIRRQRRSALPGAHGRTRCDQARAHRRIDAHPRLGRPPSVADTTAA